MANPHPATANSKVPIDATKYLPTAMQVNFPSSPGSDEYLTITNVASTYDAYDVLIPNAIKFQNPETGEIITSSGSAISLTMPLSSVTWRYDSIHAGWRVESSHLIRNPVRAHGSLYISSASATTISTVSSGGLTGDNYVKIAGTTTSLDLNNFTMPSNNRLTYKGTEDRRLHVVAHLMVVSAAVAAQKLAFKIARNGVVQNASWVRVCGVTSGASDEKVVAIHFDLDVSTDDYIEVFAANETSSENLTVNGMYLSAEAFVP
jgi:hypothetical protein